MIKLIFKSLRTLDLIGILIASILGFSLLLIGSEAMLRINATFETRATTSAPGASSAPDADATPRPSATSSATQSSGSKQRAQGYRLVIQREQGFDQALIEDIKRQDWLRSYAPFISIACPTIASAPQLPGVPQLSTQLFLEALPLAFLDVQPEGWSWQEGQRRVPIIVPSSYLSLYNLGFAPSQGLPQLSQELIMSIPFQLMIERKGKLEHFTGIIAGMSKEINTILAPVEFVSWANGIDETKVTGHADTAQHAKATSPSSEQRVGAAGSVMGKLKKLIAPPKGPRRIMLIVDSLSNPAIQEYLDEHEMSTDQLLENDRAQVILYRISSTLIAAGMLILLLAGLIAYLSIQLLLHAMARHLKTLHLLGFDTWTLARPFYLGALGIETLSVTSAYGILLIARTHIEKLTPSLFEHSIGSMMPLIAIAIGLIMSGLLSLQITLNIRKLLAIRD